MECSIQEHGDRLQLSDTKDCLAKGRVDGNGHLTLDFHGTKFEGTVTADGNHINWQDMSYWTRSKAYEVDEKQKEP